MMIMHMWQGLDHIKYCQMETLKCMDMSICPLTGSKRDLMRII